jgi:hypothetical protein
MLNPVAKAANFLVSQHSPHHLARRHAGPFFDHDEAPCGLGFSRGFVIISS